MYNMDEYNTSIKSLRLELEKAQIRTKKNALVDHVGIALLRIKGNMVKIIVICSSRWDVGFNVLPTWHEFNSDNGKTEKLASGVSGSPGLRFPEVTSPAIFYL